MGEGTNLGVARGMHVTTPPNLGFIRDQPGGNRVARPTALRVFASAMVPVLTRLRHCMQVTTVHRKQVFLAPGQHGYDPGLVGNQGALPGEHFQGRSCTSCTWCTSSCTSCLRALCCCTQASLTAPAGTTTSNSCAPLQRMCMSLLNVAVVHKQTL